MTPVPPVPMVSHGREGVDGNSGKPVRSKPQARGTEGESWKKKGPFARFFAGISWVQILSGGLAACTVFLLSARLGFAGTIVGAALASMISTFSSQLFQNILKESGRQLKKVAKEEIGPGPSSGTEGTGQANTPSAEDQTVVTRIPRVASNLSEVTDGGTEDSRLGDTSVFSPLPADGSPESAVPLPEGDEGSSAAGSGGAVPLPDASFRKKRRRAIVISVVISLLSVALVAGAILLFTNGKGTGPATPTTVQNQQSGTTGDDRSSKDETRGGTGEQTERQNQRKDSTSTDTSGGSTSGGTSDSGNANSSTQNGSGSSDSTPSAPDSPDKQDSTAPGTSNGTGTSDGSKDSPGTSDGGNNGKAQDSGKQGSDSKEQNKDNQSGKENSGVNSGSGTGSSQ